MPRSMTSLSLPCPLMHLHHHRRPLGWLLITEGHSVIFRSPFQTLRFCASLCDSEMVSSLPSLLMCISPTKSVGIAIISQLLSCPLHHRSALEANSEVVFLKIFTLVFPDIITVFESHKQF